jgi:hypothetical protein
MKTAPNRIQDLEDTTVVAHESADAFLSKCAAWLSQHEDLNHQLLSLASALRSNKHIHKPPFAFCHATNKGEMVGCAIYAEPDGLVLSETSADISAAFFHHFYNMIGVPSRIFGPVAPALRLAKVFAAASNRTQQIDSRWRVHRLDQPREHEIQVPGELTLGTADDQHLVNSWGKEYNAEKPANVDIQQFLLRKLEDGLLYFWNDGDPKCLATLSGSARCCAGMHANSAPRRGWKSGWAR